jgi:hypothetical protein
MSDTQEFPVLTDPSNGQVTHEHDRTMEAIVEVPDRSHERDPRGWGQEYTAQLAAAEMLDPIDDRPRSPRPMNTAANFTHRLSTGR